MNVSSNPPSARRRVGAWLIAAALGAGLAAVPAPASAAESELGERSLATVLTSDRNHFDRNPRDFDIVTEAVLAVLKAKPGSDVRLLADGSVPLTAFVPNDRAFRWLVKDLTGKRYKSEKRVFKQLVKAAGVDTIEKVLLYHVVPGATIDSKTALASDGAALTTALGSTFTVDVIKPAVPLVRLRDADLDDIDPRLLPGKLDINKGNKQIAHGISRVLRPINL
jgi:uncharacterized surface protein with fasciclin (FAS1) repeats